MTKEQILADLDYASALAKDGASTPLLGGRIGLMWGTLLTLVFFGQWAILSGTLDISPAYIGGLWAGFAIIGGIGSMVMGRKIDNKAGANSVANRVETYVWTLFAGYAATLFIGVVLNLLIQKSGPQTFDFIVIAAAIAAIITIIVPSLISLKAETQNG